MHVPASSRNEVVPKRGDIRGQLSRDAIVSGHEATRGRPTPSWARLAFQGCELVV